MGLSIKNPEVERLARKIAKDERISITEAIKRALQSYHKNGTVVSPKVQKARRQAFEKFVAACDNVPTNWDLSVDEILGYDENGVPTQ